MKIRHVYLRGRVYKINNRASISFWLDQWLGNKPMCVSYPIIYDLCLNQKASILEVGEAGWVVRFKIRLQGVAL
jgi:hypothetical protein